MNAQELAASNESQANIPDTHYLDISTDQLLTKGGDARIIPEPAFGVNRYGCGSIPEPDTLDFGSSTASVISVDAFDTVARLHDEIRSTCGDASDGQWYADKLEQMRGELLQLCDVAPSDGVEILFAASGTDMHLVLPQLLVQSERAVLRCIMIDPAETGSGVTFAMEGRHFNSCTAQAHPCTPGELISQNRATEVVSVALRRADGTLRNKAEVDQEFVSHAEAALEAGAGCLVVVADTTKTGCIAPSISTALDLKHRFGEKCEVLIDACQFRISAATLRAYLAHDCMVALTGSKFLGGPSFSGALLIPKSCADRLREREIPDGLGQYALRGEWPRNWLGARCLPNRANPGLLLRLAGALHELRKLRALPELAIAALLEKFAASVRDYLSVCPELELLAQAHLERPGLDHPPSWDRFPTIFPFLLYRVGNNGERILMDAQRVTRIYHLLRQDASEMAPYEHQFILAQPCRFGQPVACGYRDGKPVFALRLNIGARLISEALKHGEAGTKRLLEQMKAGFNKAALLAQMV